MYHICIYLETIYIYIHIMYVFTLMKLFALNKAIKAAIIYKHEKKTNKTLTRFDA